ncbi:MAG: membrane protein insertase YidC [Nitrospirae bacterium]|nr:membrane protein insertase YidC [Nitrospirota bacterium]
MEDMNKRILIAIVLSALVLILYPFIIPSPKPPQKEQPESQGQSVQDKEEKPHPLAGTVQISGEMGKEERTVTVETDLYKAVFTNRGGVIKHWELKRYWVDVTRAKNIVLFDPGNVAVAAYPMSVTVGEGDLSKLLNGGFYTVEGGDLALSDKNPKGVVVFTLIDPHSGKGVKKQFTFYNGTYNVDVDITPVNIAGSYTLSTGSNFGIHEWGEKAILGFVGPTTMVGSKVKKEKIGKIKGPLFYEGDIKWTAVQDKYFISALIPKDRVSKVVVKKSGDKDVQSAIEVADGQKTSLMLYAGPKEYERLRGLGVGLDNSISFGWFMFGEISVISWLAKGLFYILYLFYRLSGNYGIAIIVLTAIAKIVFIPLTYKSFKAMKDMQKLQPELQKLQKKYKDDRAALNKAMMELYKTHKVNPLGGCFPMLLQLPVFIGLYNLLASAIELRQAPLFLWIKDLSLKDPYYVMPIIMGISMLIQQKMTPSTVDPTQAKIMLIMPVMFTFFFLNFPSGLVLYWLVNNLLTIGQQVVTNKYFAAK